MTDDKYTLGLEITDYCNLNCLICFQDKANCSFLNKTIAVEIARVAYDAGFFQIDITGGEPTLHPDFLEIYNGFRKRGYIVHIYTNGYKVTKEMVDIFKNVAPHQIEITLYGMSENTYEKVTQKKGVYDTVIKNILLYKEMGMNIFLKFNILTLTKHEIPKFIKFCEQYSISYGLNAQIIPKLNGDKSPLLYRLTPSEINKIGIDFNIVFSPSQGVLHECDAGNALYITANEKIRGCAVLADEEEFKIDDFEISVRDSRKYFKNFHQKRSEKFCPAWILLEGKEQVYKFIEELK